MIDPGIWSDPTIGELTIPARLLFIGMLSLADDEGRIDLNVRYLRKEIFGYDDLTIADVCNLLSEIRLKCKNIQIYTVDDREYAVFLTWQEYQKIDRAYRSRLPDPPGYVPDTNLNEWSTNVHRVKARAAGTFDEHSTNDRRTFDDRSRLKGKELKGKELKAAIAQAPAHEAETPPDAAAELIELGLNEPQVKAAFKHIPDLTVEDVGEWAAWLPTSDKANPVGFVAWALSHGRRRPDPPLKRGNGHMHTNGLAPPPPDGTPEERQRRWEQYTAEMDAAEGIAP
jgi:hypothetical protein